MQVEAFNALQLVIVTYCQDFALPGLENELLPICQVTSSVNSFEICGVRLESTPERFHEFWSSYR